MPNPNLNPTPTPTPTPIPDPNPNPIPNPNPNQVTWEYFGVELPLKFRAGFVGATQDPVSPRVGWYIVREAGSRRRAVFRSLGKKRKKGGRRQRATLLEAPY